MKTEGGTTTADGASLAAADEHAGSWRRPSAVSVAAALVCALAAWVSFGLLAVADDPSSPRIGVLPPWWLPVAAGAVLFGLACWRRIPGRAWWPALAPSVLLLPWLPFAVPHAFLLWTGPVVWLVWGGTAVAVAAALWSGNADTAPAWRMLLAGRGGGVVVLAASLAVYAVAAWSSAIRPFGDEPQYLIITQSLLLDGDLQIENNHKRLDYVAYYTADLKPDYLRRGRNGQIYSVHAPGLPALIAPAFAVGGYPAVVVFLVFVSALGAWLVWRTAFQLTASAGAAWFGWGAVCLSVPFVSHSGAVFPDGPGAVLVMSGVAALVRLETTVSGMISPGRVQSDGNHARHLLWHGLALAALPWLHTRFAAAAGVLGACIALRLIQRKSWRALLAFGAVPAISAIAWFGYFYTIYGRFTPSAPYGSNSDSTLANMWTGLPALLLDQQFGILPNAPIYAVALAGLAWLFVRRRRLAFELAALLAVYLAAVTSFTMWWGGWSAPARFAVPVLLALGPCAAVFWASAGKADRAAGLVALVVSTIAALALATVDGGRLLLNSRDGVSLWLEWLCPLVDLPRALPSFFRSGPWQAVGTAAIWVAVIVIAWLALRVIAGSEPAPRREAAATRSALAVLAPAIFAVAAMGAVTVAWNVHGDTAVTSTSGQLRLLDGYSPAMQPVGVQYRPLRVRPSLQLLGRLRLTASARRPQPPAQLLSIRNLPAGTYRLLPRPGAGRPPAVDLTVFKAPFPLQHCAFSTTADDCIVRLPVDLVEMTTLVATAKPAGESTRGVLALQPIDPLPPADRPTSRKAIAAATYGAFSAFAFDERVFLERAGMWIEGGFDVPLVLGSSEPRTSLPALFRNGARQNTIHVRGDGLALDIVLAPREERLLTIPLGRRSRAAFLRIHADQGFRPSDTDAGSRDERYLGVWVEIQP